MGNRSANSTVKRLRAGFQSWIGIVHFLAIVRTSRLPSWLCTIPVHQGQASHSMPGHCEQCRSRNVSPEGCRCIFSLLQTKVYPVAIGLISHRVTWLGVLYCSAP